MYFEEIDLCQRLTKLNKKIYLIPNLKIDHEGGQSHNSSINQIMEISRNWHWMWSTFYYYRKYSGYLYAVYKTFRKLFRSIFNMFFFTIFYNKKKRAIYYARAFGIINAMLGKKSWYRVNILFSDQES